MWAPGYSRAELEAAQERFDLEFPPDLIALFLDRRPTRGYDWRTDGDAIRHMLAWPLEGILFDVENSGLWSPSWGERSRHPRERAETVSGIVARAPRLIPLYSHRYLPTEPCEAGNPVFSIYQSDIIYYGSDLAHYFTNEAHGWSRADPDDYRYIRFWSDLADRTDEEFAGAPPVHPRQG